MVVLPGTFDDKGRPTVKISVHYQPENIQSRAFPFIIDTGADFSVIIPQWESVLSHNFDSKGKPRKNGLRNHFEPPQTVDTFAGPLVLRRLPGCSLVFRDKNLVDHEEPDVDLYFIVQDRKGGRAVPLTGQQDLPNVLGRNILERLSLGFCRSEDCLFMTNGCGAYGDALDRYFPAKPRPEITWF